MHTTHHISSSISIFSFFVVKVQIENTTKFIINNIDLYILIHTNLKNSKFRSPMALNVTKISQISPLADSSRENPYILPLTFFDLRWLNFMPNEQVIFYKLHDSSHDSFYSVILPRLEQSLSLVLGYYLPFAGHLTWNAQDPKPCIVVLPNDTVSLIAGEISDADFSSVSGKGLRPANEIRPLVPELPVSGDSPSLLALQVTLFPNQGFSIGIVSHHVFVDAITALMLIKSWAHICKHGATTLPEDITPVLDRTAINVSAGLEERMLELVPHLSQDKDNARTLKLPPTKEVSAEVYRLKLDLTLENVEKLKERAKNESKRSHLELHLSTYVVVNAYIWTCLVKARGGDVERPVAYEYAPDFRNRLGPSVRGTYSGACVFPICCLGYKAKHFLGEDGFINAVEIISDSVKRLGSQGIEVFFDMYADKTKNIEKGTDIWAASGSNRFSIYGSDFGWGRPVNSEVVSYDQSQIFCMSEMRDGTAGVEIGLCLKKYEMDVLVSLFKNGLENNE
ncbi:BAHD acyltransferase At3g29680 [Brassica rapa]|nr:BAHD acyltransferase At3g29680 [Brassica rapa]